MKREFDAVAALGIYTGRLLDEAKGDGQGFAALHDLMDHFYPGIMTMGVAAMMDDAGAEVARQFPAIKKVDSLGEITKSNWRTWRDKALAMLPAKVALEGPLTVDWNRVQSNFDRLHA